MLIYFCVATLLHELCVFFSLIPLNLLIHFHCRISGRRVFRYNLLLRDVLTLWAWFKWEVTQEELYLAIVNFFLPFSKQVKHPILMEYFCGRFVLCFIGLIGGNARGRLNRLVNSVYIGKKKMLIMKLKVKLIFE